MLLVVTVLLYMKIYLSNLAQGYFTQAINCGKYAHQFHFLQ